MSIKHVSTNSFDADVLKADKPVLIDFWASWCGPCISFAPVLDSLSQDKEKSLIVGKVNVDEHHEIAAQFQIRSIPTLMLFKDGEMVGQKVGALSHSQLTAFLASHGL